MVGGTSAKVKAKRAPRGEKAKGDSKGETRANPSSYYSLVEASFTKIGLVSESHADLYSLLTLPYLKFYSDPKLGPEAIPGYLSLSYIPSLSSVVLAFIYSFLDPA